MCYVLYELLFIILSIPESVLLCLPIFTHVQSLILSIRVERCYCPKAFYVLKFKIVTRSINNIN